MEEKKNPKYDINRYRGMFFNVGLVLSLGLVLMAFEWKTVGVKPEVAFVEDPFNGETLIEPPPTVIPPPPKPKVEVFVLKEVVDEEIIEEVELDLDIETSEEDVTTIVEFDPPPTEEVIEVFDIVEHQPTFQGGNQAMFLKYIGERIKYPSMARRINKEGKVFVQFIIDENGNMADIKVIKGIGAGCDEEVLRVMKDAPKWEPGKQRGVPVKVRMIVPVKFTLN